MLLFLEFNHHVFSLLCCFMIWLMHIFVNKDFGETGILTALVVALILFSIYEIFYCLLHYIILL